MTQENTLSEFGAKIPKAVKICQWVSKIAVYLIFFLLPLFFLPTSPDVLDFNKQAVLLFGVFVALIAWFVKSLLISKFDFSMNLLNVPIGLMFVIMLASTVFSAWRWGSFWGWPQDTGASFLSFFSFVLLYFLVVNIFTKKEELITGLIVLMSSGFLAALFGILQLFGKFIFPFSFAQNVSFNTIGTVSSLGIFLACLLPAALSLVFIARGWPQIIFGIMTVSMSVGLLFVNYQKAWIALLAGMATILFFGIARLKEVDTRWLILPMVFLAVALLFGVFGINLPGSLNTPTEVSPNYQSTFEISKKMLGENIFLGIGPGTFKYAWSQFKSQDINQTIFWDAKFAKGGSEFIENLGTTGILGAISILALVLCFLYLAIRNLVFRKGEKVGTDWTLGIGFLGSWIAIVAAKMLTAGNISLEFLFWFFLAAFVAVFYKKGTSWKLEPSSLATMAFSFCFVLALIGGIVLFYTEATRLAAEKNYILALQKNQQGKTNEAIDLAVKAINLNPSEDIFYRSLSQLYLLQASWEGARKDATQEIILTNVNAAIGNAVNSAKVATDINPADVDNWTARGYTYRNVMGYIGGADEWAAKAYQEAVNREPLNPYIYTELGRVYLTKVNLLVGQTGVEKDILENLNSAQKNFEKAIELKQDYAPAHYQMALVYDLQGKTKEAIGKMEIVKTTAMNDVGIAFQLGLLYYGDNQPQKAQAEFERVIALSPDYSNARYFLGLIYDSTNKKAEAILQFERIEKLNADNQEIKSILANLRAGKAALEGIITSQNTVPIQEEQTK